MRCRCLTGLTVLAVAVIAAPAAAQRSRETAPRATTSAARAASLAAAAAAAPAGPSPAAPAPAASMAPFSPYIANAVRPKDPRLAPMRLAALVGLATGAAVVGAGAYFGYRSVDAQDTAAQHCRAGTVCDARGEQLHAKADEWRNLATTTVALGGGLLLAGGIIFGLTFLTTGGTRLDPPHIGKLKIEPGLGQLRVKTTF